MHPAAAPSGTGQVLLGLGLPRQCPSAPSSPAHDRPAAPVPLPRCRFHPPPPRRPTGPGRGGPAPTAVGATSPTRSGRSRSPASAGRLKGGDPVLPGREQPARGEPDGQRRARALKDGARRDRGPAAAARAHDAPVAERPALAVAAARTGEALRPPEPVQIVEAIRGGPRNSDSLLRWDPDPGEGVWHATEETELSG